MTYLGIVRFQLVGRAYGEAGAMPGTDLALAPEPRNRFDPNAIAVVSTAGRVGYVDANSAAFLAPLLTTGAIEIGGPRLARPEACVAGDLGDLTLQADVYGDLGKLFAGRDAACATAFDEAAAALERVHGGVGAAQVMDAIGIWSVEGEPVPEVVLFRALVMSAAEIAGRSEDEAALPNDRRSA